jgi:hypothetical protein
MRAAVILDLPGHFGSIEASGIWNRVASYQLDRLYFDIRQINNQIINYCKSRSTVAGINIDPKAWFNEDLAAGAIRTNKKLIELGFTGANVAGLCPVMFDYEEHSIVNVVAGLRQWRRARYKRDTIWTFEPLQGGWVGDPQMQAVIKPDRNLILMPQCYRFDMGPVAQDACFEDLTRFYAPQQVKLYYQSFYKELGADARYPIHEAWDGAMYDLSHMPLP